MNADDLKAMSKIEAAIKEQGYSLLSVKSMVRVSAFTGDEEIFTVKFHHDHEIAKSGNQRSSGNDGVPLSEISK